MMQESSLLGKLLPPINVYRYFRRTQCARAKPIRSEGKRSAAEQCRSVKRFDEWNERSEPERVLFVFQRRAAAESGMRERNSETLAAGKRSEPNEARSTDMTSV